MRTINRIFSLLAIASLAAFVGCQPEEKFQPGEPENEACQGVFFPKQKKIEEVQIFDPTMAKLDTIKVSRTNEDSTLTITPKVTLSYLDAKGNTVDADSATTALFKVPDIKFEDGQVETIIPIDFSGIEEGIQYSLHIAIEGDEYSSIYSSALKACDYKVMCVKYVDFVSPADTTKPAKIFFTQTKWAEVHSAYMKYYEVGGVRHCITYGEETAATEAEHPTWSFDGGFWGEDPDVHLEFDWYVKESEECDCSDGVHPCSISGVDGIPEGAQMIRLRPTALVDWGGYQFYPYDYYSYYVDKNGYARSFIHFINANSLLDCVSYYDGNGGFYFWVYGITSAQEGWVGLWPQDYDIVGISEGYVRSDFKVELTAGITQADSEAKNVVPVDFKLGADVAKVGYTVTKGALSGAQVNAEGLAIAKDTIKYEYAHYVDAAGVSFSDSISVAETGVYTLVAVGFDAKKKAQTTASVTFNYLATGETSEVILNVEASSSAQYASRGYSPTTSIVYEISGSGLTGVIPLIYSEAEVAGDGGIDAIVADMLADPNYFYSILGDKDYAAYYLSAKQLADANDKGYVDIPTGLKANTTYYVIVWATNGYDTAVKYATQTTDGLPNVIVKEGTGTYTYTLFFCDTDDDDNAIPTDEEGFDLEFNPNNNMYEIPNWGPLGVTLSYAVAADSSVTVPAVYTGYDSGYGPVYIGDFSQIDVVCGNGACAYFGIDPTLTGYMDEDGNIHLLVAYLVSAGYFGLGYEHFYPDGKPAAAPAPSFAPKYSLTLPGAIKAMKNNHFVHLKDVKGLEVSHERVVAGHKIGSAFGDKTKFDNPVFTTR